MQKIVNMNVRWCVEMGEYKTPEEYWITSIQYCDPISPPIPDIRGYYDSPPARG